jgi:anthranilate synthase/aminodeoxychorismate synthase-like glutamine amidotransferase
MRRRALLVDNYDSFTWNLAHLLERCGAEVEVVRNDAVTVPEVFARSPTHLVISPGPGAPDQAGVSCELIRQTLGRIPILGVCLGHQALAVALGGSTRRVDPPVHGESSRVVHEGRGLFARLPAKFAAARYHSLAIEEDTLPGDLVVDARCESDPALVMAIRHRLHPAFGVQFHPESFLTECGPALVSTFLETAP